VQDFIHPQKKKVDTKKPLIDWLNQRAVQMPYKEVHIRQTLMQILVDI